MNDSEQFQPSSDQQQSPPIANQQPTPPPPEDPEISKLISDQQSPKSDDDLAYKPEEEFMVWTAPNRPFKRRNREFFTTVALIVILVSLILFFANQFLLIAVVMSLGFLAYVLSSVPPEMVENKLTSYGIYSGTHSQYWFEMGRFWFAKKYDHLILHIETVNFPYRMMLLLDESQKTQVEKIMNKYLLQEVPKPTSFDKAADWLSEKVPLDREEKIRPQVKKSS